LGRCVNAKFARSGTWWRRCGFTCSGQRVGHAVDRRRHYAMLWYYRDLRLVFLRDIVFVDCHVCLKWFGLVCTVGGMWNHYLLCISVASTGLSLLYNICRIFLEIATWTVLFSVPFVNCNGAMHLTGCQALFGIDLHGFFFLSIDLCMFFLSLFYIIICVHLS